jgi:hypothetical protein
MSSSEASLTSVQVGNLAGGGTVRVPFNIFCGTCSFYSNCHNTNPEAAVGGIYGYSNPDPKAWPPTTFPASFAFAARASTT